MKKPSAVKIRSVPPLSVRATSDEAGGPFVCKVCNGPSSDLGVWREHDEMDRPTERLIYIGKDHAACLREMELHPRLYAEVMGDPGTFPLCGDCTHREAFRCRHPSLKANGGPGLQVILTDPFPGAICIRTRAGNMADGRMRRARECTGKAPR